MIIVSQKRHSIINFESLDGIAINEANSMFSIIAMTTNTNIKIAEYETLERAKEILEEIIKAKSNKIMITYKEYKPIREQISRAKLIKNMQDEIGVISVDQDSKIESLPDCTVYYMPEE